MADFPACDCRSLSAVCCTPGTSDEGGITLDMDWMLASILLCGSEPGGNSGNAPCNMLMASLTFAMAPACEPGEPDGTEIGEDPMGGCPESEGGIIAGKGKNPFKPEVNGLLPFMLPAATSHHGILSRLGGSSLTPRLRPTSCLCPSGKRVQDVAEPTSVGLRHELWPAHVMYLHVWGAST